MLVVPKSVEGLLVKIMLCRLCQCHHNCDLSFILDFAKFGIFLTSNPLTLGIIGSLDFGELVSRWVRILR